MIASGFGLAASAAPVPDDTKQDKPKEKKDKGHNLLHRLHYYQQETLRFLTDARVPFTNNLAEQDLRMAKVQQKVAGTFRSAAGATAYCRLRSYLSTMRKQGRGMLEALAAVFYGRPLPVAWGS